MVEAKKLTFGPQNVLTQAERYGRGLRQTGYNFDGCRCPFLYSTNGEIIWFHDVRHGLNRSRRVAAFHTPAARTELLTRDFGAACSKLLALANDLARTQFPQLYHCLGSASLATVTAVTALGQPA